MVRRIVQITFVVISLLIVHSAVWAQSTGTIEGTVNDSTGALVPHAKVTAINQATQDKRDTVSSGEGFFSFAGLVSGDYSIKIQAKGFRGWEQTGIHILPGDRKKVEGVSLVVGSESESITVTAAIGEVQVTDSGDLASVVTSNQMQNSAMQGRDATELVKTLPGFSDVSGGLYNTRSDATRSGLIGGNSLTSLSSNGMPGTGSNGSGGVDLVSDGARIIDPGVNSSSIATINADMTSELKVTTSAYSAENNHGPVVIQAIGKSGASKYHGELYYHFRDHTMDSNQAFNKLNGVPRQYSRQSYPGGNFSGPVHIPGTNFNKNNRLVFFSAYEYNRQRIPDNVTAGLITDNLPTGDERQGFLNPTLSNSSLKVDNSTNCAALGQNASLSWVINSFQWRCKDFSSMWVNQTSAATNVSAQTVPIKNDDISNLIGPGAKTYLAMVPLPNHTPTATYPYNYVSPVINYENGHTFHERVDYAYSDNTKLYFTYQYQIDDWGIPVGQYFAGSNPLVYQAGAGYLNRSHTLAADIIHTFNSTTTNEFQATLGYGSLPVKYKTGDKVTKTATDFPFATIGQGSSYIPWLWNTYSAATGVPSVGGPDLSHYISRKTTPGFNDTFTKLIGSHAIKAGFSYQHVSNVQQTLFHGSNGTLSENGYSFSSALNYGNQNVLANFLTDMVPSYSSQADTVIDPANVQYGFFGEDTWKTNKKLTLTLGLRLDHIGPWFDDMPGGHGFAVFTKAYYDADMATGVVNYPGVRTHSKDSSIPLSGRTTQAIFVEPRLGVAYDVFGTGKTVLRGGIGRYYFQDSYNTVSQAESLGNGAVSCGFNTSTQFASLAQVAAGVGILCSGATSNLASINPIDPTDKHMPGTYTYNFTISQQTFKRSKLEASYQGSQTSELPNPVNNINVIPAGSYYNNNPNPATIAAGHWGTKAVPISDIVSGTSSASSTYIADLFRPMTNYSSISLQKHGAWSNYNAFQLSWTRPAARGLSFNLNYTWSKTMGIQGAFDPVNIHKDYGVLGQNRPHVLNASYSYDVGPRFKSNRVLSLMLADWVVSGLTTIQSGADFQTNSSQNLGLSGTTDYNPVTTYPYGPFGPSTTTHDQINGSYFLGSVDYSYVMPKLICNKPTHGDVKNQYFNAACFAIPQEQNYGQSYWLPTFSTPMNWNSDAALNKSFHIKDRQNLQFRGEATNFLNHSLNSFNPQQTSNQSLTTSTTNSSGQTVPAHIVTTSGSTLVGQTNAKFGVRIVTVSVKYNF